MLLIGNSFPTYFIFSRHWASPSWMISRPLDSLHRKYFTGFQHFVNHTLLFLPRLPSIWPYQPPRKDSLPSDLALSTGNLRLASWESCRKNIFFQGNSYFDSLHTNSPWTAGSRKLSHNLCSNAVPEQILGGLLNFVCKCVFLLIYMLHLSPLSICVHLSQSKAERVYVPRMEPKVEEARPLMLRS